MSDSRRSRARFSEQCGFAAGRDSIVYPAGISVYTQLAYKGLLVYTVKLFFGLSKRLIDMRLC
jgi:hypothetical protein